MPSDEWPGVSSPRDALRPHLSEIRRTNGQFRILIDPACNSNKRFHLYVAVRRTKKFLWFCPLAHLSATVFPKSHDNKSIPAWRPLRHALTNLREYFSVCAAPHIANQPGGLNLFAPSVTPSRRTPGMPAMSAAAPAARICSPNVCPRTVRFGRKGYKCTDGLRMAGIASCYANECACY